jgi:alpha-tubulin suppressor-like RCC1 family protein
MVVSAKGGGARLVSLLALMLALVLIPAATAQAVGGSVMGWGQNEVGQVGTGAPGGFYNEPVSVKGIATATAVSSNFENGMALLADGTVRAWGGGRSGQLGNGGVADSATPVAVPGLTSVVAIASGEESAVALLADGTVRPWGDNRRGQLGLGTTVGPETCPELSNPCSKHPVTVPGLTNVVAIAADEGTVLALLADGSVMAWGGGADGQLGDGSFHPGACFCVPSPVRVPGVSGAVAVSLGSEFGMALLADGSIRTWGSNDFGQLGIGATSSSLLTAQVPAGIPAAKAIVAGDRQAFALLPSGVAYSWGNNYNGELGRGFKTSEECACIPLPGPDPGFTARELAAGGNFSLALLGNGTVLGFGHNSYGKLGDGTAVSERATPAPVKNLTGASAITGTGSTAFAIVGPSQSLGVSFAGASPGNVGTGGLVCAAACSGPFSQGAVRTLRAEPAASFAGWTGACTGTGPCRVRLDSDQNVTATFGPPAGTAITKAVIKPKKKKATFSFTAPGAVTGYECKLTKPAKKKAKGKKGSGKGQTSATKKKAAKKKKPKFTACASPKTYKKLKPGAYKFEVRALDSLGADPQPALKKFSLKKPKPKHRKHAS